MRCIWITVWSICLLRYAPQILLCWTFSLFLFHFFLNFSFCQNPALHVVFVACAVCIQTVKIYYLFQIVLRASVGRQAVHFIRCAGLLGLVLVLTSSNFNIICATRANKSDGDSNSITAFATHIQSESSPFVVGYNSILAYRHSHRVLLNK